MAKGVPTLPDLRPFIAAGINPRTGLPIKFDSGDKSNLDTEIKKAIRIMDEQDAVNRYTWSNLPTNITGQELERLIYYKGQLCFFYMPELREFYFMPYALNGTIDFYGRFNTVKPVPMTSGTDEDVKAQRKRMGLQLSLLERISLNVKYGVVDMDELDPNEKLKTMTKSCVLLHDYTKQLSQTIIPRANINEPILGMMSECFPFMRTSLIAGSGIRGIRVNDADQADSVEAANSSILRSALTGRINIPMIGSLEFQDLTNGQPIKSEEYMIALQSIDNFRKSTYGIENGGVFEKKAHMLESENDVNISSAQNQFQDGLSIRQNFCNIVNSIWGLGIWCEPSENVIMQDIDNDGKGYDENDDGEKSSVESSEGDNE